MVVYNFSKPFLKWVGGKRNLLETIEKNLPNFFNVYFEPFLGGGAVFYHISNQVDECHLGDINEELINTYTVVKNEVDALIENLKTFKNTQEYFLFVRDWDRIDGYYQRFNSVDRAARFIYLNRTCFNGLYRVNGKGQFNSSYGFYENPKIVDVPTLKGCSFALNSPSVSLSCNSYDNFLTLAKNKVAQGKTVFFYLDPPYVPISESSNFTGYSKENFTLDDHHKLKDFCDQLTESGILWMQSNSSARLVYELYKEYRIREVSAKRKVSGTVQGRSDVTELLITNYMPQRQIF